MNRTTRTLLVVVVAILAAGVATFAAYRAIQSIPVREVEVAHVQLAVAARPLPVGTMVTPDDVKLVPWPASAQVPGAFTTREQVVNRGLIDAMVENEPFSEAKLAPVGAGAGLPPTIPEGMRAVSIRVNEVIGVAGFVVPGTRVDVLVTVRSGQATPEPQTRVVLSNVQVLAAGTRYDQDRATAEGKPIPTSVVTLAVTPEDAEKLTLAAEEGRVMLTLRNPLDQEPTQTDGTRFSALLGKPSPPPIRQVTPTGRTVVRSAPTPAPEKPKIYTVEAIRAAKRSEEEVR